MFVEETKWFFEKITALPSDSVFPAVNIGSCTGIYRSKTQPHIDRFLFMPLKNQNLKVIHVDIQKAPGVDLSGDLSNPSFQATLKQLQAKSVFCNHLLEHVTNPKSICDFILELLPENGYIFVSCPFKYPYHPDPIDTLFRPGIQELADLFPNTRIIEATVIHSRFFSTMKPYFIPFYLVLKLIRLFLPFYKPRNWIQAWVNLPYLVTGYHGTCLIAQKLSMTPTNESVIS